MECKVDDSKDENVIIIRDYVDKYLTDYNIETTMDKRNEIIQNISNLIKKKFVGPENKIFKLNKSSIIDTVVNSYMFQK